MRNQDTLKCCELRPFRPLKILSTFSNCVSSLLFFNPNTSVQYRNKRKAHDNSTGECFLIFCDARVSLQNRAVNRRQIADEILHVHRISYGSRMEDELDDREDRHRIEQGFREVWLRDGGDVRATGSSINSREMQASLAGLASCFQSVFKHRSTRLTRLFLTWFPVHPVSPTFTFLRERECTLASNVSRKGYSIWFAGMIPAYFAYEISCLCGRYFLSLFHVPSRRKIVYIYIIYIYICVQFQNNTFSLTPFFSFGLLLEDFRLISNDGLWRKKKEKEKCWFLI